MSQMQDRERLTKDMVSQSHRAGIGAAHSLSPSTLELQEAIAAASAVQGFNDPGNGKSRSKDNFQESMEPAEYNKVHVEREVQTRQPNINETGMLLWEI